MLDEREYKPFSLNDFNVVETSSSGNNNQTTEGVEPPATLVGNKNPSQEGNTIEESDRVDLERKDQLTSFKPLRFEVEGEDEELVSHDLESFKSDDEKIQLSKDFKNSEFFRENSLLTNAEDFAEAIRSGAKLYKTQLLTKIEEQVSDTQRIYQQTIEENQEAEKERKNLLSSTEEKVEEIKSNAFKEGFESGLQKGIQKRYDEAKPKVDQIDSVLDQLKSLRQVIRFTAEEELVKLSLKIAKNVVAEEIKLNKSVINNIVQLALHETEVHGKIYLFLHPDDYEFLIKSKSKLEQNLSDEQILVIRKNPKMKPGSIYVESDEEIISRSIEGQFDKLEGFLNEGIETRHSHLNEVDIDAYDFSSRVPSEIGQEELKIKGSSQSEDDEKIEITSKMEKIVKNNLGANQTDQSDQLEGTQTFELESVQSDSLIPEEKKSNSLDEKDLS